MKTGKRFSGILAIVLVLAMAFSFTAFAEDANGNWSTYQGNSVHNGIVTSAAPLISSLGTLTAANYLTPALNTSGTGWSGVDTVPVMETYGGTTYAYVVYNGRTNGGQLSRINCATGTTVGSVQISTGSSSQLSTPYLDATSGKIYVAGTDYFRVLDNNEFTTTSSWALSGGAAITTAAAEDEAYVTIPAGGSVAQTFAYTATSTNQSQLTSGLKLSASGSATVTYVLTKPDSITVTLATQSVTSSTDWTYVEVLGTTDLSTTGNYTLTVTVSGASVICDYVTYSKQTSGIKAVTRDLASVSDVAYATYGGQINTPLVVYGQYMYFGTYSGSYKYYQVDLNNSNTSTNTISYTGSSHFYWAGAYCDGTYVYFGGDGGKLYIRPVGGTFGSATGTTINLTSYVNSPGNVRSTLMYDDGYLYFTSQGGYLWKYNISSGTMIYANIGGTSTSTPTLSGKDYLYVGCYGGAPYRGVRALELSDFTANITSASDAKWKTIYSGAAVQSSVVAYTSGTNDYLYFTTNASSGAGYCYSYDTDLDESSSAWTTPSGTFTLQGMAACNGYLTFGNDANTFYVIH